MQSPGQDHQDAIVNKRKVMKVRLGVPEAPRIEAVAPVDLRKVKADRLRIGILDNRKGNADRLLQLLVEGISAAIPVSAVIALRKATPSMPAPAPFFDQLVAETDFVISAMGD